MCSRRVSRFGHSSSKVEWRATERQHRHRECLNLANHFSGSAREQQREDYWTVLRPSRLRIQSGICAAAQSVTSLFTLDPDPLPSFSPSFSFSTRGTHSLSLLPTRSPFFAASIKGQRGKTTSLCWSCGSMSRGLRTTMGGGRGSD